MSSTHIGVDERGGAHLRTQLTSRVGILMGVFLVTMLSGQVNCQTASGLLQASNPLTAFDRARSPRTGGGDSHVGQIFCVGFVTKSCDAAFNNFCDLFDELRDPVPIRIRIAPGTYTQDCRKKPHRRKKYGSTN